jgi:hypothetical protein
VFGLQIHVAALLLDFFLWPFWVPPARLQLFGVACALACALD